MARSSDRDKFLQRRGLSWYVRVRVPPSLQSTVGNTHVRRALKTKDRREAERRKWRAVAEIKAHLDRLRRGEPPAAQPQRPQGDPRGWADQIRRLREEGDHDAADTLELVAFSKAEEIEAKTGRRAAERWLQAATTEAKTLDELIEQWLAGATYTEQTKATYRRVFGDLRALLGLTDDEHVFAEDITDTIAVRYVADYLPAQGYAPQSIANRVGALSSFWAFLQQRLAVPLGRNPWQGHRITRGARNASGPRSRKTTDEKERAFTDGELVALLHGTERATKWGVYPRVRDLLILGLYTGARLNELASLIVQDVVINKDNPAHALLHIRQGKTAAASRTAAVTHWAALELLQRRTEGKPGGAQVFDELRPGGLDGKLSWAVSKAFTRYRRECGVPDGTDYHSLRRTFLTLMEQKGTDYVAVARFVGHQVPTMMHAVYSAGASREALLKVADAARYGPDVERVVAGLSAP